MGLVLLYMEKYRDKFFGSGSGSGPKYVRTSGGIEGCYRTVSYRCAFIYPPNAPLATATATAPWL